MKSSINIIQQSPHNLYIVYSSSINNTNMTSVQKYIVAETPAPLNLGILNFVL